MNQYVVVKGDTLWKIARANNLSLDALLAANPQITDPNYIMPGQVLNIPGASVSNDNAATGTCPPGDPFCPFNLPLANGKTNAWGRMNNGMMNGITNGTMPPIDRSMLTACDATASMRPCVYTTVAAGETLELIAQKFMVPLSKIMYYNPCFGRQAPLIAGARVVIPEGTATMQQQRLPRQYQRYSRRR